MSDLIEIASRIMMTADRRLEQTASNLANTATAGYRSSALFSEIMASSGPNSFDKIANISINTQKYIENIEVGGLVSSGSALDVSIIGDGYFSVRTDSGSAFTRAGRFSLAPDGRVVSPEGYVLQDASGGDLVLQSPVPEVLPDGTVMEGGVSVGRIGVFSFGEQLPERRGGGVLFAAPDDASPAASSATLRQGVYEGSNVSMPAEMIEMMRAVKQAESGARLAQAYDGLLGQAITTFGQRK